MPASTRSWLLLIPALAQPAAGGGRLCGAGRVRSGDDDDERTKICSNAGWDGALT